MSSEKSNVYVVQETRRKDMETGEWVPMHDFRPASKYGTIRVLLANPIGIAVQPAIATLRNRLRNFCDDDYLLLAGDPVAIYLAGAIASEMNQGRVNLLRYDKVRKEYIHIPSDLRGSTSVDIL